MIGLSFNGFSLTGMEDVSNIELTPDGGDIILTGLNAPTNSIRIRYTIYNLGAADNVILQGSNGSSDPEDQFAHAGDLIIAPGRKKEVSYNPSTNRYFVD